MLYRLYLTPSLTEVCITVKKFLKGSHQLLLDNGFVASGGESSFRIKQNDNQVHGVTILCNSKTLQIRIHFHYTFLQPMSRGASPSTPIMDMTSLDFPLWGEVARFERPLRKRCAWRKGFDDEWDGEFIVLKMRFALSLLQDYSQKWANPEVLMDLLRPEAFIYKTYQPGADTTPEEHSCVASWLISPWLCNNDALLCSLAASIAELHGYTDLVKEYQDVYRSEYCGESELIRLRTDQKEQ